MKPPEPLAIDQLLTEDERRPLSVAGHHQFRKSIAGPARAYDEVDELVEELRKAEFEERASRP